MVYVSSPVLSARRSVDPDPHKEEPATLLDILGFFSAGTLTVTVGGYPLLSVRSDQREVDLEVEGVQRAGLSLSELIKLEEEGKGTLITSEHIAKKLSSIRWRLTLYDRGSRILTMGSGVSRMTGRVRVNPLKLKRLLRALR
jgi:hypothetical protein